MPPGVRLACSAPLDRTDHRTALGVHYMTAIAQYGSTTARLLLAAVEPTPCARAGRYADMFVGSTSAFAELAFHLIRDRAGPHVPFLGLRDGDGAPETKREGGDDETGRENI